MIGWTFIGTVAETFKRDLAAREVAQVEGMRRAARGLEKDLEAATASAGLGKLSKAWESRVYPNRGGSLAAAAIVYPKGGESIQKAFHAFSHGAVVRAQGGPMLAIPTDAAPKRGTDGKRINPSNFPPGLGPLRFVYRRGRPSLLVADGLRARTGKRGGFARASARATAAGTTATVVMFILVPLVRIGRRLNINAMEARWRAQVPALIAQEYEERTAGG